MIFHSTYNKPILLVGNGVRTSNCIEKIHEFCCKHCIPLLTTMNAVDLAQDKFHIGFIGTHGNRIANIILNECDLVISIGARLGIRQVGKDPKAFAPKAKLIRVDIDDAELSRTIKVDEKKYQMDAMEFIEILSNENVPNYKDWLEKCMKTKEILQDYDKTEGNLAIEEISKLLPENPIVAIDVGQNQCWAAQSLHLKGNKGRILIGGGYGTMGCGLPYAIGSSIAKQNQPIFCICGDGGLQMNIQELETINREKLPIKILVLNNKVLGKISETQHFNHNNRFAITTKEGGYTVPNFVKIAEAYGIKSINVNNYQKISEYKEWFYNLEPCLINIELSENSFLIPKINFETGIIEPIIRSDIYEMIINILR